MGRPVVPIRQLDRRLPELGRIKDGVKVPTGKGGERPKSIETLRFTSQDPKALAQVAAQLGGEVKAYTDPKSTDTHELVAPVAETPVILPPDPLGGTPMYEHYSGGGRERWCDGITCEQWRKGPEGPEPFEVPCPCAAAGELSCRPTVHLSVILPFTRLGGTWRWTTHSYNAAVELPGMVEAIQSLQAKGLTRGVLRVDKRTQTIAGVTRKFVVPVLGVDTTADELAAGQATLGALGAGTPVSIAPPAVAEIPERVTPDRVLMSGGGETDSLPSPAAGGSSDDDGAPPAPVVDNTQSGGDGPPPSSPAAPGPTQKGGGDDDSAGKGSSPVVATAAAVGDMGSSEAESEPPPATEQQGDGGASAPSSPSGPVPVDKLLAATRAATPAARTIRVMQATRHAAATLGVDCPPTPEAVADDQALAAKVLQALEAEHGPAPVVSDEHVAWKVHDQPSWDRWRKRCNAKAGPGAKDKPHPRLLDDGDDYDLQRHALAWMASRKFRGDDLAVTSWDDVTKAEAEAIEAALGAIKDGEAAWTFTAEAWPEPVMAVTGGWVLERAKGAAA